MTAPDLRERRNGRPAQVAAAGGSSILLWMAVGSAIAAGLCMDPLVGLCGLAATCLVALLRRQDDSLVLLFCLGYQWMFIAAGVVYRGAFGRYPSDYVSDHIDAAVRLLLLSIVLMGAGVSVALMLWARVPAWQSRRSQFAERSAYAIDKLFLGVVLVYAGSWFSTTSPKLVAYSISQVLYRVMEFRSVLLFLLLLAVLRWQRGWLLAAVACVFVTLPLVTGGGSAFATVFLVLLAAALTERKGLFVEGLQTRRGRRTFALLCVVTVTLINLGILWQGAVKSKWRPIARSSELEASRFDRIGMFFEVASASLDELHWRQGLDSLAERISDVPMLLALTLDRVPTVVPHEDGQLTARAIRHISTPRFLFPDKENLGGDSWLVRKFAGLNVAGEAQGTSVGLGYLIEFYVDFGAPGMLVAAFVFGACIGSLHRLLLFAAPSMDLYRAAAAAILLQHFFALDASLAKILGGMVMAYAVFGGLLLLFGGVLHRTLLAQPVEHRSQAPSRVQTSRVSQQSPGTSRLVSTGDRPIRSGGNRLDRSVPSRRTSEELA